MTARTRLPVALVVGLAALFSAPSVPADAELVLADGRVLAGADVALRGEDYVLTLSTGESVTIPKALVTELRLVESAPPPPDRAPSGLELAEPRVLAGPPHPEPLPRQHEQLEAFGGGASTFPRSVIDPTWQPTSGIDLVSTLDQSSPVRWYRSPIDPTWTPTSAFTRAGDVTEFSPVRWSKGIEHEPWWPKDGFRARREAAARLFGESAD